MVQSHTRYYLDKRQIICHIHLRVYHLSYRLPYADELKNSAAAENDNDDGYDEVPGNGGADYGPALPNDPTTDIAYASENDYNYDADKTDTKNASTNGETEYVDYASNEEYDDETTDAQGNAGSDYVGEETYDYEEANNGNANAQTYDDAGNEYGDAYDDAEQDYADGYDYEQDYENDDTYTDEESDYGEYNEGLLKLKNSLEILDRNMPEPGFDLSYEEIMKLKLWPDALIPYYIDVYSFNDKVMRDKIRSFLSSVNSLTALNFVELPSPPSNDMRWVFFVNRRGLLGCADHSIRNFTNAGVQQVVLGYHCMSTEGELAEAVLAIAGVPAQHNSPDRDYYIKINEENIIPEKKYLFEKRTDDEWLFHNLEYDFDSAGHFHSFKHSINGRATIELQKKTDIPVAIGESRELTARDILKIRMLYNFIVKKKLLQAPDCHKLFEPGKKFSKYKPGDQNKPRPKPFEYTGEAPNAPLDEDDVEIDPDQTIDNNDDDLVGAPNVENYPVDPPEHEYEGPNTTQILEYDNDEDNEEDHQSIGDANEYNPPDYDYGPPEYENPNQYGPQEEEESDNFSPGDFNNEKAPDIVNIKEGLISGAHQNNIEKLFGKRPSKRPDPLTVLSDFQTDEDDKPRKTRLKKMDLKFQKYG